MDLLNARPNSRVQVVHSYVCHHCEHFVECRTSDKVMTGKWLDVKLVSIWGRDPSILLTISSSPMACFDAPSFLNDQCINTRQQLLMATQDKAFICTRSISTTRTFGTLRSSWITKIWLNCINMYMAVQFVQKLPMNLTRLRFLGIGE